MGEISPLFDRFATETAKKLVNKITVDHHINLRLTSNNDNPISIPHDDRPYVVFEEKGIFNCTILNIRIHW